MKDTADLVDLNLHIRVCPKGFLASKASLMKTQTTFKMQAKTEHSFKKNVTVHYARIQVHVSANRIQWQP